MNLFGAKELYGVTLKCTSIMKIKDSWYEENEPIISFDKIQIAYLNELKNRTSSRGGANNQVFVKWEDTAGMDIQFTEGLVSQTGMSLLSNSKIFSKTTESAAIPYNENVEAFKEDEQWFLELRHIPYSRPYVYYNGQKISNFSKDKNNSRRILIDPPVDEDFCYTVYYDFLYTGHTDVLTVGDRLTNSFLSLTGRMRLKDDQSGKETTCLVEFPKIELMSDLTLRLGNVAPMVHSFHLRAHPVGDRGHQYVCKFTMLDRDIDSDF